MGGSLKRSREFYTVSTPVDDASSYANDKMSDQSVVSSFESEGGI